MTVFITLTTAGTYYPVVSLRLKTTTLDDIVILTALSLLGDGNNVNYNWKVLNADTVTGGTWVSAGASSGVEYNISATGTSGGDVLASGYFSSSNQSSASVDILKEALFKFQLERNSFTSTPSTLTLVVTSNTGGASVYGSMDWEEVTR